MVRPAESCKDPLTIDDPCVVFALRREAAPLLRTFRPQQVFPGSPCWARFCGPSWLTVLVLQTGMGPAAEAAVTWLCQGPRLGDVPYRPKVVLSAGYAGALQPDLRIGDLVLATEIVDAEGHGWSATWPGELPPGAWRPPLQRGRVLTMPRMVTTPAEKQALGQRHQALDEDMEAALLARCCRRAGVPFGCLRAISDDIVTPLSPRLAGLLSGGRPAAGRVLTEIVRSPRLVGELWRLARATRYAGGQLGLGLGELLTLTLPWGREL